MQAIVMSSDEKGVFHLKPLDDIKDVPSEAEFDNQAEIDGDIIPVYAMPGTAVVGRTFVLQSWLEDELGIEVETDDDLNIYDPEEDDYHDIAF